MGKIECFESSPAGGIPRDKKWFAHEILILVAIYVMPEYNNVNILFFYMVRHHPAPWTVSNALMGGGGGVNALFTHLPSATK